MDPLVPKGCYSELQTSVNVLGLKKTALGAGNNIHILRICAGDGGECATHSSPEQDKCYVLSVLDSQGLDPIDGWQSSARGTCCLSGIGWYR